MTAVGPLLRHGSLVASVFSCTLSTSLVWPIATGVIEGACRHLIKDRMDLTGARWTLPSAEAVLKLRALLINGDFDDYWTYHLTQEKYRVHETYYANEIIPVV